MYAVALPHGDISVDTLRCVLFFSLGDADSEACTRFEGMKEVKEKRKDGKVHHII